MKTIKTLFVTCCLLLSFNTIARQQVSMEEARTVAAQTLNLRKSKGVAYDEKRVKKANTLKNKMGKTLMYEVIFDDGQGVLLSGSKACLPVLGYFTCEEGQSIFDDDMPDGLKFMLGEYKEQIERCFQNDTVRLYYQSKWQALQQEASVSKTVTTKATTPNGSIVVAPLLTSHWAQAKPNKGDQLNPEQCNAYNYYASVGNCDNCRTKRLAGCVAVAMAQIIYYWRYPVYTPFQGVVYDWCNMADLLNTNSSNYINERNAVARLIRDCGDAVDMDFGCSASGANTKDAQSAFVGRFGYSSDADFQRRIWHGDAVWKGRIKHNLNQGWPVLYGGQSALLFPDKAHAFVCDGYSSDDMFHFNWGWIGNHETWFTLDDLTPSGGNYNTLQDAVFYIHPSSNQDYCNFELSLLNHYSIQYAGLLELAFNGIPFSQSAIDAIPQNVPKHATRLTSAYPTTTTIGNFNYVVPSSWYTIESGTTRGYVAHETIYLKPGFVAKAGSNFTARIEPCNNCNRSVASPLHFSPNVLTTSLATPEEAMLEKLNLQETEKGSTDFVNRNIDFILYPNPNDGNFTIAITNAEALPCVVEIFNIIGLLVGKTESSITHVNINRSDLSNGIYFVKVSNGRSSIAKRLVLQQ